MKETMQLLPSLLCFGLCGGSVQAALSYWDANGAAPGDGGIGLLTFNSTLTLYGNLLIEVDKLFPARNESLSLSNDTVEVDGTLVNSGSGTVTVVNLGPALKAGDTFYLFKDSSYNNKALANGQNMTVVSAGGGVVWANNLAVNGSISVVSATAPAAPNTNLTVAAAGPGSFKLLAAGAAGSAYNLFAFTNLTTPQSNWWVLGTTNADGNGLIQFLDTQATNARRFYRIGPVAAANPTPPSGHGAHSGRQLHDGQLHGHERRQQR